MNRSSLEIGQRWIDLVNNGDLDGVVRLYHNEATFHPTLLGEFIQDKNGVRHYFTRFLSMNPHVKMIRFDIQELHDTAFVFAGNMGIEVDGRDGRSTIQARFTFIWATKGKDWSIIHHHNSIVPT